MTKWADKLTYTKYQTLDRKRLLHRLSWMINLSISEFFGFFRQ